MHFTQKKNSVTREDFDEFVRVYKPGAIGERRQTWSEKNPDGRWRKFDLDELANRDKLNLDLLWIKDRTLEDSDSLPEPDVLAAEIAEDLQDAMEQFAAIALAMNGTEPTAGE